VTDSDRRLSRASHAPARVGPHARLRRDDETTTDRDQKGGEDRPLALRDEDREVIRRAGREDARRSRAAQGLPERIEDPAAIASLAAMLRDAITPGDSTPKEQPEHGRRPAA
jgi:hypothetical protein